MKWQQTARLFAREGRQTRESIARQFCVTYSQAIRRIKTLQDIGVVIETRYEGQSAVYTVKDWGPLNPAWHREH